MTASAGAAAVRVLVLDPQHLFAGAFATAIGAWSAFHVVGVEPDETRALVVAQRAVPDVVVVEPVGLPRGLSGLMGELDQVSPGSRVVALSSTADYPSVVGALEVGVSAVLLKSQSIDELATAMLRANAGHPQVAPDLVPLLVRRVRRAAQPRSLSAREADALHLLAGGASIKEVAVGLGVTFHTARNHVQRAIRRLGAHSSREAVKLAQHEGLITCSCTPDHACSPRRAGWG